mmetsp:Transcript_117047/g.335806  ORF Transcript_117047/g.335806 Transcript_117047/m.335806 type:complete len:304 (+) Transcript_117047:610-1521(+)
MLACALLVRMHVQACNRTLMAFIHLRDAHLGAMQVHLAHRTILRADIEHIGLVLREGDRGHGQLSPVFRFVLQVNRVLRHIQHGQGPHANPAVVGGGDQIRRVLCANLPQRLHGMRVALAAEGRAQHRRRPGPGVPHDDAACVGPPVEERGVEAVEVGREDGARAGKAQLRPVLHGQVPNQQAAVRVGKRSIYALAVRGQEHGILVRRKLQVRDGSPLCPLVLAVLLDEFDAVLHALASAFCRLCGLPIRCDIPVLRTQRPFDEQSRPGEEVLEVREAHDPVLLRLAQRLLVLLLARTCLRVL